MQFALPLRFLMNELQNVHENISKKPISNYGFIYLILIA